MNTEELSTLLDSYKKAPNIYQATSYWQYYEDQLADTIGSIDLNQIRSGRYPVLASFGFNDTRYQYANKLKRWKRGVYKVIQHVLDKNIPILPHRMKISDLQQLALRHCEIAQQLSGAIPLQNLEASVFGGPQDIFEIDSRKYTISFLNYYLRYCFVCNSMKLSGNEVVVELGSGSGYQVEVLKKLYPELTILCFDLPIQIFLCQNYLKNVLPESTLISTVDTSSWNDLSRLRPGGIHFFGNWQFPLLKDFEFDLFWNAASFGEMEPAVVRNYLSTIVGNAQWIYLLQARFGKETKNQVAHVQEPMSFDFYNGLLSPTHKLLEEHDAWTPLRKLSDSGGYFEAIWQRA